MDVPLSQHVAAYLHLHVAAIPTSVVKRSLATLATSLSWTRSLLAPLLAAIDLEGPDANMVRQWWGAMVTGSPAGCHGQWEGLRGVPWSLGA